MTEVSIKKKNYHVCLGIVLFVVVVALFIAGWYYVDGISSYEEVRGQFGDKFGAVNALFSGLAFAGLIYTIILQHDELGCQREELANNRAEMKQQTEELKKENLNLRVQRFENTFFDMLTLQQQIIEGLAYRYDEKVMIKESTTDSIIPYNNKETIIERTVKGREFFRFVFMEALHHTPDGDFVGLSKVMEREGQYAYTEYYSSSYFDHYFRHFYSILKFIKQNEWLGWEEQYRYASILRASLSRYELVWIYYNGLSENGNEKLKPLLEEFSMLKNLRTDLLVLCKENAELMKDKGVNVGDIQWGNFSGTDYEFFLHASDQPLNSLYHIKAFYSKKDIDKGVEYLREWKKFWQDLEKQLQL